MFAEAEIMFVLELGPPTGTCPHLIPWFFLGVMDRLGSMESVQPVFDEQVKVLEAGISSTLKA